MADTRREKNRAKILNAARSLFLDLGFERTSMDEISVRASVSKTTLYAHFTDKTELFLSVVNQGAETLNDCIAQLTTDEHKTAPQKLEDLAFQVLSSTTAVDMVDMLRIAITDRGRHEGLGRIFSRSADQLLLRAVATILYEDPEKGEYAATFEEALLEARLYLRISITSIYIDVLLDSKFRPTFEVLRSYISLATGIFMNSRSILKRRNQESKILIDLP